MASGFITKDELNKPGSATISEVQVANLNLIKVNGCRMLKSDGHFMG